MSNSKKQLSIFSCVLFSFIICTTFSCDSPTPVDISVTNSDTIRNLYAPSTTASSTSSTGRPVDSGVYVKFSFKTGKVVAADSKNWDIAFRGSYLIVNGGQKTTDPDEPERTGKGGIYFENSLFSEVTKADPSKVKQDASDKFAISTEPGKGWYNYNPSNRTATPVAGRVFVVRTHDEKYAKFVISSFYKDNNIADPRASSYYTFNYVYQDRLGNLSFVK